jgi:predicted TIM-barrel fold metal-dependent hydrolase
MIVDFHAHVFPPQVCRHREEYLRRDPTFRELYSNPKAALATADDLLASMDEAGIDKSVIVNFVWQDSALRRLANDYILDSAAASGGRLLPFCVVHPATGDEARAEVERCARKGALGLGELRPDNQGFDLAASPEADLLIWAARTHGLALLFHVSEPVGHSYPGKSGLAVDSLYRFIERASGVAVIAAHWGGGLPFYGLMPRVKKVLATTYFDTAAGPLLYSPDVYRHAISILGVEHILFATDFPFLSQRRCLRETKRVDLDEEERHLILGGNALRLLGLPDDGS